MLPVPEFPHGISLANCSLPRFPETVNKHPILEDVTPEERWQKIENALETVAKRQAEFEQNMLRAERRQDRLDRRVMLYARFGLRQIPRNERDHARMNAT